jgi:hypothetical protein
MTRMEKPRIFHTSIEWVRRRVVARGLQRLPANAGLPDRALSE